MQGIFRKENTDKALKYGIYRHLPTYEKIIRNLVSFYIKNSNAPNPNKPNHIGATILINYDGKVLLESRKDSERCAFIGGGLF